MATLLARAGVPFACQPAVRQGVPAVMLGDATQALITDVLGRASLFEGLHRIERRVVAWGVGAVPKALPHAAIILSEAELIARLAAPAGASDGTVSRPWTLHTSPPLPPGVIEHQFGSRRARAVAVRLREQPDYAACWIESLETGWLFLIPHAAAAGWLLAVGDSPLTLLESSRLIAPEVVSMAGQGGEFPAHPRIAAPICGEGWLACGSAAMAFDPICGDGTGNAVREALLAAAVVRSTDPSTGDLLLHYRRRLLMGFGRHLEQCRPFYATGGTGEWWRTELARIDDGIAWCRRQLSDSPPAVQFQLRDFDLMRVTTAGR